MTNHPRGKVPDDSSAAWLIERVAALQKPPIIDSLRTRVHDARRYRDFLAHPGGLIPGDVQFSEALGRLTHFVDRLADPPY